mmetsp:Transcript_30402/g.100982  ORF Transcript_30402/g.100982 Transcript_30402/m.100982 type:complete len:115 (+) Transcript_30402:75-419(+)
MRPAWKRSSSCSIKRGWHQGRTPAATRDEGVMFDRVPTKAKDIGTVLRSLGIAASEAWRVPRTLEQAQLREFVDEASHSGSGLVMFLEFLSYAMQAQSAVACVHCLGSGRAKAV